MDRIRLINHEFPFVRLGFAPTPLAPLPRISERLGIRVLIKRDDQTGLAFGGNKTRKLEFLVADALARGCDTLVTGGAQQSNHCRQTAAAAAACGLACHLALAGEEPARAGGNLLLDRLLGAIPHYCGPLRKGESIPLIAEELRRRGHTPCVIPYGGSSGLGALGFVKAALELKAQLDETGEAPSAIVFASSSGGTHGGLLLGAVQAGLHARLLGIEIDKGEAGEGPFADRILEIAAEAAALLKASRTVIPSEVDLARQFTGDGYGVVGDPERNAIRLMAAQEGILLDPVYTGRAFGALVELARLGELGRGPVVFWHTGGGPALFPYAGDLA